MVNHPNRSKNVPPRFVGYSTASMNALSEGKSIEEALHNCDSNLWGFLIIAEVRSKDVLHRLDVLPHDAVIVWRGENYLAQEFWRTK
jgi:hypothetical protein